MIHNFTTFDMKANEGYCFVWHEAPRGVTADNYFSIICAFITDHVLIQLEPNQNIILHGDGCYAENRHVTLSNALLKLAAEHKITFEQKYTQIEADPMHSLIESLKIQI